VGRLGVLHSNTKQSIIIKQSSNQSVIMKKSIIFLSFALVVFSNIAMASTVKSSFAVTINNEVTATPLAAAIAKGDVKSVKAFIAYGININERSNDMTPLMLAARYNQVEIMNILIANGASLKETNTKGFTALKYAQLSNAHDAIAVITKESNAVALNRKQSARRSTI